MGIEQYLFNITTLDHTLLGQGFQASTRTGTSKFITTRHQATTNYHEALILEPYLGKPKTILPNTFRFWSKNGIEVDVAEIPLHNDAGGIEVAELDVRENHLSIPNSRQGSEVAAVMLYLSVIHFTDYQPFDDHCVYVKSWTHEQRIDFGNSGSPLLNSDMKVVGVVTDKVVGPNLPYGGMGQLISWNFK